MAASEAIWLPGATGSGPYQVAQAWATAFGAMHPEARLTLTSVGSGAAQKALWGDIDCAEKPVEAICAQQEDKEQVVTSSTVWGLGDAPIKASLYQEQSSLQLQQFPACAGAVTIVYAKEGRDEETPLHMSFDVLSGIFNQSIAFWDDPAIQRLNPSHTLPHEHISVVVREDSSGQTSIITDALGYHIPSWPLDAIGKRPNWPLGELMRPSDISSNQRCNEHDMVDDLMTNTSLTDPTRQHYQADGKSGVALGMLRVPYSIGYMEVGFASTLTDFLGQADIGTSSSFVDANPESLRTTMRGLVDYLNPETLELNLASAPTPTGGYPIAGKILFHKSLPFTQMRVLTFAILSGCFD